MDIAVSEYMKRRAERLAARGIESGVTGIRPKINSNWDRPLEVTSYQKKRNKRLEQKGLEPFRLDAPDDENNNNNNNGGGGDGGGHGNTRLPFGLCKRYGIAIEAGWGPREAWDALAGKGITPDGAYARLKKGEDPGAPSVEIPEPKKSKNVSIGDDRFKITGAEKYGPEVSTDKPWVLKGIKDGDTYGEDFVKDFASKREMLKFLKEQGVESFTDPETGEELNPKEMEIPEPVTKFAAARYGGAEYDKIKGYYASWSSRGMNPWRLEATRIEGSGDGSYSPSVYRKNFWTKTDMMMWLKEQGVEEFRDMETGQMVNPQEMEFPEKLFDDGGRGYDEMSIGLRGGRYALVGRDFAGKKRTIRDFESLAQAEEWFSSRGGDVSKLKMSPSLRKREKERVGWLTSDKKEYLTADDGKKYGDLLLAIGDGWPVRYYLTGESEGGEKETWTFKTKAEAMKFMKEQGVEKVRTGKDGKEIKNPMEFEAPPTVAKIDDREYQKIAVVVPPYGEPVLYGVDLDGGKHKIKAKSSFETYDEFYEKIVRDYGLSDEQISTSAEDKEKIEKIREADAEKARRKKEFEEKAIAFGPRKYLDPEVKVDDDGDFRLMGYDSYGEEVNISGYGDMYDMVKWCERSGRNPEEFMKDPRVKSEYEKYKEARDNFEAKAVEIGGEKYADVGIIYDGKMFKVRGFDERGRTKEPARVFTLKDLEDTLSTTGMSIDSFPMDDSAKEQIRKARKARELISTGDYYSMGGKDTAYTDLRIEKDKDGSDWHIYGKDGDGKEVRVKTLDSWDDAVSEMSVQGVKNYKIMDGDTELGMPKDGIHKVILMKKPGGGYAIYADTDSGTHQVVHEANDETEARNWLREKNVPTGGIKTRGMNPNDDVERHHTEKTLNNFDTYRMEKIEGSFVDDMSEDEKKDTVDMLTEMFNQGQYRVFRSPKSMFGILTDRYKSQPEVGRGGAAAAHDPEGRRRASKKFFGHSGVENNEYEKCGYLGLPDSDDDWSNDARAYGGSNPVMYTFKKDRMNDRVTYTYGDSLNTRYSLTRAGYGGPKPTIEGVTALYDKKPLKRAVDAYKAYKRGEISYKDFFNKASSEGNNEYIELQYHGDVTPEDIESVAFRNKEGMGKAFEGMSEEKRKKVFESLKKNNIKITYREEGKPVDAWEELRKRYGADI